MEISQEQLENIKKQIIQHIDSSFPEDKKEFAKKQLDSMNPEELIEFIKQNNLIQNTTQEQKCIFCSIISGELSSFKIEEFKNAIAVLEINPISKGHVLVLPKEHIFEKEEVERKTKRLVSKIKKKINYFLKPKEIIISYSQLFEHGSINLIPIYTNETINSKRKPADKKELEDLQSILKKKIRTTKKKKVRKKIIKKKIKKQEKIIEKEENSFKINSWNLDRIP